MPDHVEKPLVELSLGPSKRDELRGERIELRIDGMHCASCVQRVQQALASVAGVYAARVNLALNQATVLADRKSATLEALQRAVATAGYQAKLIDFRRGGDDPFAVQQRESVAWRRRFIVALALLVPQVVLHFAHLHGAGNRLIAVTLATLMQFHVGWPFLAGAWQRLRHGGANMDTLVALGTGAAYAAGLVEAWHGATTMNLMDAGMILTFISLGRWLEALSKGRASLAIRRLLDLTPPEATVVRRGQHVRVPLSEVAVGETIVVPPGQRVPLDARVTEGVSSVDESWLTGEPLPVDKQVGDAILAGVVNGQGALTAMVVKGAGDTALARVVDLVRRAQESKAPIEQLADRVVAWFVPVVLVIAAATLVAWGVFGGDANAGLSAAVAVLVVACPCAMGLATPTAVLVGSGRGAELGILIKDAAALEIAGRLTTFVFDKTGTITLGKPRVVAIEPADGVAREELLGVAASMERLSAHPLAACVVAEAEKCGVAISDAASLKVVPGEGVTATLAERDAMVGNERLLARNGIDIEAARAAIDEQRATGATPLLVARGGEYLGLIALADTVAPGSAAAIGELQSLGFDTLLLSGDHRHSVEAVARQVGIAQVRAEVLPADKQQVVGNLRAQGKVVAMIGDGINDAPAMAEADLGIAMGRGADVAIETAQIVLTGHDLRGVVRAVALARATLRTIRENLFWAFGYNVLLIPLAAGAFVPLVGWRLPPSLAAAAMAASSVSVVANSLRLRTAKLERFERS